MGHNSKGVSASGFIANRVTVNLEDAVLQEQKLWSILEVSLIIPYLCACFNRV